MMRKLRIDDPLDAFAVMRHPTCAHGLHSLQTPRWPSWYVSCAVFLIWRVGELG